MTSVLVDINVVLDVMLDRQPHVMASAAIWSAIETGKARGYLAAHAVTTIFYFVEKDRGSAQAKRTISAMLRVFAVALVDATVIQEALLHAAPDFEDSVTAVAARFAGCDLIITRDPKGFRTSGVKAISPEAALPLIYP